MWQVWKCLWTLTSHPNPPPTPPQEEISNVAEHTQVKGNSVACDKSVSLHENMNKVKKAEKDTAN